MPGRGVVFVFLGMIGLALGGCVEATLSPAPETNLKPRDRQYLRKDRLKCRRIPYG